LPLHGVHDLTIEEKLFPRLRPHVNVPVLRSVPLALWYLGVPCVACYIMADLCALQYVGWAALSSENVTARRHDSFNDKLHPTPRSQASGKATRCFVNCLGRVPPCMVMARPTALTGRSAEGPSWSRGMAAGPWARGTYRTRYRFVDAAYRRRTLS
jgi:hypothetical protein